MSLEVGKEFPNKSPTNINPEKVDTPHSIEVNNNAIHCFWIHMYVLKSNRQEVMDTFK